MNPIASLPQAVAQNVRVIFSDIDDTMTTDGRIPATAFDAIWRAHDAGLKIVPVTGRPAGWCDHIARMWPVSAVVGENGALAFSMRDGQIARLLTARHHDAAQRLDVIKDEVLRAVPGCKVAADQDYRAYDLAIDFCEEVPALTVEAVTKIADIFRSHGATAKVSSIHVNGWFGDFDKLTMCKRVAEQWFGQPLATSRDIYIGDSPNDAPMFAAFDHACGVANVRDFIGRMDANPTYIATQHGGQGFAEIVNHILALR